jgi:hypothetical protein
MDCCILDAEAFVNGIGPLKESINSKNDQVPSLKIDI